MSEQITTDHPSAKDLVSRLRDADTDVIHRIGHLLEPDEQDTIYGEAADEIERLRRQLYYVEDAYPDVVMEARRRCARATDWQRIARERTADLGKADEKIERLQEANAELLKRNVILATAHEPMAADRIAGILRQRDRSAVYEDLIDKVGDAIEAMERASQPPEAGHLSFVALHILDELENHESDFTRQEIAAHFRNELTRLGLTKTAESG